MRRISLAAILILLVTATPAHADPGQREWREVFSANRSITQMLLRTQKEASMLAAAAATVIPLQQTGPSSERFDLVFVGDGYTASQQTLFRDHAAAKWAEVSSVEVMALGNSTKYGGAGYTSGRLATASGGNAQSGQVAVHEFGHSIGKLADEFAKCVEIHRGAADAIPLEVVFLPRRTRSCAAWASRSTWLG